MSRLLICSSCKKEITSKDGVTLMGVGRGVAFVIIHTKCFDEHPEQYKGYKKSESLLSEQINKFKAVSWFVIIIAAAFASGIIYELIPNIKTLGFTFIVLALFVILIAGAWVIGPVFNLIKLRKIEKLN